MTEPVLDADALVASASAAVGLTIDPAYLPGVVSFVKLAADMAATLDLADLPPDDGALAPVFRLPDPG